MDFLDYDLFLLEEEKMEKQRAHGDIITKINTAERIALFAHKNPDGDAYGSTLGMKKLLENMGKQVKVFLPDVSDVYDFLPGYSDIKTTFDYGIYDLIIIMDCSTYDRLAHFYKENSEYFVTMAEKMIVIDHHIPGSNSFQIPQSNILQYDYYASTCELLYDLFSEVYVQYFDQDVATSLLLGIYTDTGGFKYGENIENSFKVAAGLTRMGADKDLLVYAYIQARKFNEVKFAAHLIDNAKISGRILWASYDEVDLAQFDIDTERASLGLNILQTVKWDGIIIVVRYISGVLKFSMRSKGDLNVGKIADSFGGGGHKNAAGFGVMIGEVEDYLSEVDQVLVKVEDMID